MKITVIKDRVLLRKIPVSASDGYGETHLIKIPEDCEKVFKMCGEVLAVGTGVREDIHRGDIVLFRPYNEWSATTECATDGEFAIVPEQDIEAVIDGIPKYLHLVPWDAREYDEVA